MSLVNLNVIFDQSDFIFYTGQPITGQVAFLLKSPRTLTCVKIKIKGKCKTKWSDLVTGADSKGKLQFGRVWRFGSETYFKTEIPLDPQQGKFTLSPGQYLYPFSIMLPPNLPASFIGLHGRIFYYAKATVMSENRDDVEKKIFFRVKNILNLNYFPALQAPIILEKHRKLYWCCCIFSGEIRINASIPKTGFSRNEIIPLSLRVKNDTYLPVRELLIYMNRKIEWRAGEYCKSTIERLKTINIRTINANTTHHWTESIPLPLTDTPFIENCHLITMKHELQIKVDAVQLNCDFDLFLPISIGDVPINDEVDDLPPSYGDIVGDTRQVNRPNSDIGVTVISS